MCSLVTLPHSEESKQELYPPFLTTKKLFCQTFSANVDCSDAVLKILNENRRQYSESTPSGSTSSDSEDAEFANTGTEKLVKVSAAHLLFEHMERKMFGWRPYSLHGSVPVSV